MERDPDSHSTRRRETATAVALIILEWALLFPNAVGVGVGVGVATLVDKRKYRKKGRFVKRAMRWLGRVIRYQPGLFVHWRSARPFLG